jgi:hypothetical protein
MSDQHFRFWTVWREPSPLVADVTVDMAAPHVFYDLDTARRAHRSACDGRWVKDGWSGVHVSALKVWKWGRELPEELAGKQDRCDVHGGWGCSVCETKREAA